MSATQRSLEDARAKHDLMGQYIEECERIDDFDLPEFIQSKDDPRFAITDAERLDVFHRRRERILKELENKGIRIHAESETLKSLAGVIEQNHANKEPSP